AQEGMHHWLAQRFTAVSNLFLMLCLVWSALHMPGWSYPAFTGWLSAPVNSILMILVVVSVFYHAALGLQVIIEDYVHNEACKLGKLILIRFTLCAAAVVCIFSVLKISFGG
ncbi:MAG TPA: succinate dehydrogenase, hydrophobic membrane anchor protein, partial [Alphaproteobacteria bacterium]